MAKYEVCYYDARGNQSSLHGDSLEELSRGLAEAGYDGPSIRVTDDPGFTIGWVSATNWRYQ